MCTRYLWLTTTSKTCFWTTPTSPIRNHAHHQGYHSLLHDALSKVASGITSLDEISDLPYRYILERRKNDFTATCSLNGRHARQRTQVFNLQQVHAGRAAVRFHSKTLAGAYRACIQSRIASRILLRFIGFRGPEALYDGINPSIGQSIFQERPPSGLMSSAPPNNSDTANSQLGLPKMPLSIS